MSALVWFFAIFGARNTGEAQGWLSYVRDIAKTDDEYRNVIWAMRYPGPAPTPKWAWYPAAKREFAAPLTGSNVRSILLAHEARKQK